MLRADSLHEPIATMQTVWLGHQRGVVQSTFRKFQHRLPISTTIPATVVSSRSIVTPTPCLKKETWSSLPPRQRSTSSYLDHQSTTTTLLFTPTVKQQHSVGQFHTHSCQQRKGTIRFAQPCIRMTSNLIAIHIWF